MADLAQLLGPRPADGFRRDLLIEYLHRLNDHFGVLHDRHVVALAKQMNLPMAEVYEVASFYHHFDIVRGDDAQAPRLVLRVCDSLSCSMAGARELLEALPARLQAAGQGDVQVVAVPCVGRCEQAPVAVVHQCPVPHATVDAVLETVSLMPNRAVALHPQAPAAINFDVAALAEQSVPAQPEGISPAYADLAAYREQGGYQTAAALVNGEMDAEAVLAAMEDSGLRGLGGAGGEEHSPVTRRGQPRPHRPGHLPRPRRLSDGRCAGEWRDGCRGRTRGHGKLGLAGPGRGGISGRAQVEDC